MNIIIQLTPFDQYADASDSTGLTQAGFEKLSLMLSDFAEEWDIEIQRKDNE